MQEYPKRHTKILAHILRAYPSKYYRNIYVFSPTLKQLKVIHSKFPDSRIHVSLLGEYQIDAEKVKQYVLDHSDTMTLSISCQYVIGKFDMVIIGILYCNREKSNKDIRKTFRKNCPTLRAETLIMYDERVGKYWVD